ncbi:uncharacterized protein LOC100164547 [Acyrthosiphon pisum]|uniref:Uncharacterized protein n=1 Tax=Acyrthosiphon pisum TaxID=7029 RepID=X1WN39_ACYPI|nr:uncharacterized protein LOC100164547 [Acyrthosiphon pisum]|eukprot:XP_008185653.1 PREDICTED: uncharacterized protein LOC100164547 [Acyrthosiphon pisum]
MQQTWQSNESLADAWQNWKEFIIIYFIVLPIEIIGMIILTMYHEYLFGDHFAKLDKNHKIAEWDIFIGTMILIVTNFILLYINLESMPQTRDVRKIKKWLIFYSIGLCIYLIITVNFHIVLRYLSVYNEYSNLYISVVGWSYFMNIILWFGIVFVYYISYKPIASAYRRSLGNGP